MKTPRLLMKFAAGTSALENATLRFTQPNFLNDPFELLPFTLMTIPPTEKGTPRFAPLERAEIEKQYGVFCSKYGILSLSGPSGREAIDFSSPIGNLLMWSHYANSHQGLVMVLDPTHPSIAELGAMERVEYSTERVAFVDKVSKLDMRSLMLRKSPHWSYENEWRIIEPLSNCKQVSDTVFVKEFHPDALRGVVVGAAAPEEFVREVVSLLNRKYPRCPSTGKMHLASDSFRVIPLPFDYPQPLYIGTTPLPDTAHVLFGEINVELRSNNAILVTNADKYRDYIDSMRK